MPGRLPRLSGVVATVDTAGEGVHIPSGGLSVPWLFTVGSVGANNRVEVSRFILPFRLVVRRVVFAISTSDASSFSAVGIYNSDGTSLLVDSGAISSATTGIKSVTLSPAVTLEPGVHILAWTATTTTVAFQAGNFINASSIYRDIVNKNNVQFGDAANASSSGVLPATTGSLSSNNVQFALVGLEP